MDIPEEMLIVILLSKRWSFLACFALIMLLPLITGFEGDYTPSSSLGSSITAPRAAEPRLEIMADSVAGGSLSLDKNAYDPGEEIKVSFNAPQGYANNAWIGIIPSSVAHGSEEENDKHDLAYQYLSGRTSGVLAFYSPMQLGSYDLRMHDSDDNGKEVASVTFSVRVSMGSLRLDREAYEPGEEIAVHFEASKGYPRDAWVGIVPSSVPHGSEEENDKHDLAYQYLEKKTAGTLVFQAPLDPGSYDLRMHDTDSDGREVAYTTFSVSPGPGGAGNCGPQGIVGTWSWFNGDTTTINSDGTATQRGPSQGYPGVTGCCGYQGITGRWELTDAQKQSYTLTWENGRWIDKLTLSADCNSLDGYNQEGVHVTGQRIAAGHGGCIDGLKNTKQISGDWHWFDSALEYYKKGWLNENSSYQINGDAITISGPPRTYASFTPKNHPTWFATPPPMLTKIANGDWSITAHIKCEEKSLSGGGLIVIGEDHTPLAVFVGYTHERVAVLNLEKGGTGQDTGISPSSDFALAGITGDTYYLRLCRIGNRIVGEMRGSPAGSWFEVGKNVPALNDTKLPDRVEIGLVLLNDDHGYPEGNLSAEFTEISMEEGGT